MRKFLKILILTFLGAVTITSCSDDSDGIPGWPWNDNSTEKPDEPDVAEAKPRYIWIDAAANFPDYANSKENIAKDMEKIKAAGFTDIIVDVRPTTGDVLFNTNVVDQVKRMDVWGNSVVIAGMGGNLIRDILEADMEKVNSLESLILVPAQNPEVLREYLYENNYEIIKEDLCFDEGVYYELFKVKRAEDNELNMEIAKFILENAELESITMRKEVRD